jgi:integrase
MGVKVRQKKLSDGSIALYLDIYHKGSRKKEWLNLYLTKDKMRNRESLHVAETRCAQRQIELAAAPSGVAPTFKRKGNFVQFFEDCSKTKNRSWNTVLLYLTEFTGGSLSFDAINNKWLEDFQKFLLKSVSPNSASTYYNKIKAALELATRDGMYTVNPAKTVKPLHQKSAERIFLTIDEVRLLSETPCNDTEVKRAFLFSCFTGLRLSDVKALRWGNVLNDRLHFKQKKTGGQEYLPISKSAQALLGASGEKQQLVFRLPKSEWGIWDNVVKWGEKAGIEKHISFHTSRHTFATLALSNNVDLYTVSKLLGHSSIAHTQIYAKVVDKQKRQAVDLLPEL